MNAQQRKGKSCNKQCVCNIKDVDKRLKESFLVWLKGGDSHFSAIFVLYNNFL